MRRCIRPTLITAAALAVTALALAGCGSTRTTPTNNIRTAITRTAATRRAPRTLPAPQLACLPGRLRVKLAPRMSMATQEHAYAFTVVNRGQTACRLIGYPAVTISAGNRTLPFRYADGGGPYITARPPETITLAPGGRALFVVAKSACVLGIVANADSIRIWLPGVPGSRTLSLPKPYIEGYSYCRRSSSLPHPTPGNTVVVSPVVRGIGATIPSAWLTPAS